jgi:hypothetical protein
MPKNPGLGEQALNKAVEIGLSSQLDAVENLDINIKTEPLKLVQGEVDTVTIAGEGLVMQKDLRMEEIQMEMSSVAINPLSIAFGKIELTKQTTGSVRVVLTAADINRAFNCDYIRAKLQNQKIKVNERVVTTAIKNVEFYLPGNEKFALNAGILLVETGENYQVAFSAIPRISPNRQSVYLENVEYGEGAEISPKLTKALIDETSEILNLSNFDLPGMSLRIHSLEVKIGKLILQAAADVEQITYS